MAFAHGLESSYANTYLGKTMISDRIIMADPYDITTILALGLDNASKFRFVNAPGRTYSWLEDTKTDTVSATNETDLYTDSALTTFTIEASHSDLFHVGDVIQIDSELMCVTAITALTLTVIRDFNGSTAATHATTSTITIRYNARLEGADSDESSWNEVSTQVNYSTILHKEVLISRDDMLFPHYGIGDLLTYKIDKNMDALMEQLDTMPYYSKDGEVGTASTPRSAGGFHGYISTNTGTQTGALLKANIDQELLDIYDAGGKTDLILCGGWFQKKVNDFYEGFVSTERAEGIGGIVIKQLMHPITGQYIKVVVDRHCPSDHAFLLDTRHVGYITIDPFFYEQLAKHGDAVKGQTVGSGFSTTL
jgi:hypothetical protein